MRIALALAIALLPSLALAQQPRDIALPLSVEDQKNFREICGAAMRNDHVVTETTYSIAAWCLMMSSRMAQAVAQPIAPPSPGKE